MFGFRRKQPIENEMAEWLAHPSEFGVRPKAVRFRRTYKCKLLTSGSVEIHLVNYEMPDGTVGKGFVNGGLTWSFIGKEANSIPDDDLLRAYCGWAWLFPALQSGSVRTAFVSIAEEANFAAKKKKEGVGNFEITSRFKIGTSELFEFTATQMGKRVKGAGDSNADVTFTEEDVRSSLPSIYFFLADQVIQSMR